MQARFKKLVEILATHGILPASKKCHAPQS